MSKPTGDYNSECIKGTPANLQNPGSHSGESVSTQAT